MAQSNVRKSTFSLFLVLLTAGFCATLANGSAAALHFSPTWADNGGGGLPAPPDPGPKSMSVAIHLG